jgi:pyruvate kinase
MNFSHGEYEYHQSVIDNTRKMVACAPVLRFPPSLPS